MPAVSTASLVAPPAAELLDLLGTLPSPALLYDFDGLARSMDILMTDLASVGNAQLNMALKACHTPRVLAFLASLGLGADVASPGELELAATAGFPRITATGPSFTVADLPALRRHGVLLDASSIEQFTAVAEADPGSDLGIRLRVPLPPAIEDGRTTFGTGSRFGVLATDRRIRAVLERTGGRLTRLHTHTGQMTPQHLRYKVRYLLTVAEAYTDVAEIDLGGGFFSLYHRRDQALQAWSDVRTHLEDFTRRTGRTIRIQVEPGGAILAPHGYLVTTVSAAEPGHSAFDADLLTVDASAWNFAPWHKPQVIPLTEARDDEELRPTLVAGNTLYENDFFGNDVLGNKFTYPLPAMQAGDRLVFTAAGAYTMTNSRRFNRLPLPAEFTLHAGEIEAL